MRALLVVPDQDELACPTPLCLFPVIDRPFLQHVVEAMAGRGVTEVEVVCGRGAAAVERFLGDGDRWGCSFSYHLMGDPERPGQVLRVLAADAGPVLLARADCLPPLPESLGAFAAGVLLGRPGDWSGWAVAEARELARAPEGPSADLAAYFASRGFTWKDVGRPVVLRSPPDVPAAQRAFLCREVPGALVAAREVRPGVWVARNVAIAEGCEIEPPVYVGENTEVGGARLGPFAVVGPDCMIDSDATVRDATVCGGTYVGAGVELDGVVAHGRTLMNPARRTAAAIDSRLLDTLVPAIPSFPGVWRLLAAAAYTLTLPAVLAAACWVRLTRPGPVFWPRRFVRAAETGEHPGELGTVYTLVPPRPDEAETGWVIPATFRGLVLELLPALACVAWGTLRLVGVPPRGRESFRRRGNRCPSLLRAAPGLITEAALCDAERQSPEDCVLVDAYQAETSTQLQNLKRVCRFVLRALTAWGKPTAPTAADLAAVGRPSVGLTGAALAPIVAPLPADEPGELAPDAAR